ncbi:MAG: type II toxin-antitoxin system VapC family toxin [Candidatus Aenigmarchaeota archaeon]|nr:type II toxin-antitoxin system VapC family toxin [Candidatus Aenigmarchaeota archaeon]
MERQKKVVDASIIVKWFNNEPGSEEALALEKKHAIEEVVLIVPELAFAETLNALKWSGAKQQDLENANR